MEAKAEKRTVIFPIAATAPDVTWRPTSKDCLVIDKAELREDEVGELVMAEIYNPTDQDIKGLWFYVDDIEETRAYTYISGKRDSNMLPPHQLVKKQIYSFGKPGTRELINNTTIKFKTTCLPRALAGPGGIAADQASVVLHYFVYKENILPAVFGALDGVVRIADEAVGRGFNLQRPDLAGRTVSKDIWDAMPGGRTQAKPKIFPLIRYATNAKAVPIERDYEFDFDDGEVAFPEQNLWFNTKLNQIIVVEGLGIRPHNNSLYTALKVEGDSHPAWEIYTKPTHNKLHFGHGFPILPMDDPSYYTVPLFPGKRVIFAQTIRGDLPSEAGGVVHRATGAVIPPDNVTAALTGIKIEL